jgi:hypothetical protein
VLATTFSMTDREQQSAVGALLEGSAGNLMEGHIGCLNGDGLTLLRSKDIL